MNPDDGAGVEPLEGMEMIKDVYELPNDESTADAQLYARLQREAQAREDLAQTAPLAKLIGTLPPKPRFVDGRWVTL